MSIEALQLRNDRRLVLIVLALTIAPVFLFLRFDATGHVPGAPFVHTRLVVRISMAVVCVLGMVLMRYAQTRQAYSRIVLGLSIAIATLLFVLASLRPQGSTLSTRGPLLNLFLCYTAFPNTLLKQIIPPLFLTAGMIGLRMFWVTGGEDEMAGDVVAFITVSVIGVILVLRRLELEESVRQTWWAEHDARVVADRTLSELRTLRGIIPICAHCKQVRTDVGDWQAVERYVASNSEAQFSHGICPTCVVEHFPELELESQR